MTHKCLYYSLMVRGLGKLTYAKYYMNYKSIGGAADGSTPSFEMFMYIYQTLYNRLCNSNVSDAYMGMNWLTGHTDERFITSDTEAYHWI